jgi:hypothetical protein
MSKLRPEHVGKLPPGEAADLKRDLREYRKAAREGLVAGLRILSTCGCTVSEAQEGIVYRLDQVPPLPLAGCTRSPCCCCDYAAVLPTESVERWIDSGT